MSISITYRVQTSEGSYLGTEGYSQYNKNWKLFVENKKDSPYSKEDAIAHAKEYFAREDEYTYERRKVELKIIRVATVISELETIKYNG